jgi:glycosyltransferase involved in cell wall biosynthesis
VAPKVIIISQSEVSAKYLADMLRKAGVTSESVSAQELGLNLRNIREFVRRIKRIKIVHFIAGYQRVKLMFLLRLLGKKIINQWVGTDVLSATEKRSSRLLASATDHLVDLQLANSDWLVKELREIGIKATYSPTVPRINDQLSIVQQIGVLVYIPQDRIDFHHGRRILEFARMFEDIDFHVVDNDGKGLPDIPNIHYHGWIDDMDRIWQEVSILIRFPRHDGQAFMVLEALARGKWVIWNQPMPYCSLVKRLEDVPLELKKLLARRTPNLQGRQHVLSEFNTEVIGLRYAEAYRTLMGPG